jgi:putative transposase
MRHGGHQLELPAPPTWGGRRDGAGRPPAAGRRHVLHRRRAGHDRRWPVHVTLRACVEVPSLRRGDVFGAVRAGFSKTSTKSFRVLHFSVQHDHVHLLVEAEPSGLRRGVQGLTIRIAKAINRTLGRRGKVWADRYHSRALKTPREVRHALVYVLQNWRKHLRGVRGLDPRSSAGWFTGWQTSMAAPPGRSPVVRARTWLASVGWRRNGLVGMDESPHRGRPARSRTSRCD